MNIGIDIDDTINSLALVLQKYATEYNKKNNIDFKINFNAWNWNKAFGWTEEQANDFLKNNIELAYKEAQIKDNAKEVINKLREEGNNIIIITSRSNRHCPNPYKVSEEWLKSNNVCYDKLVTNGINKAEKCIENEIDIFIDDHIDFCEDVLKNTNTKVLMFDSPYNQNENRFKRVYNWKEIYEVIKKEEIA